MQSDPVQAVAVLIVLLLPLGLSIWQYMRRSGTPDASQFALNVGGNGLLSTTAGAISGNIGIGTFLALFLFSQSSPIIGFSIAVTYTFGLFLCAAFAPILHARGQLFESVGLIDLIAKSHRVDKRIWIWAPLATVFVLRSAVQIGALALIAQSALAGQPITAVLACTSVLGLYLVIGGYRAAVQSDIAQAAVLLAGVMLAASGLSLPATGLRPVFNFGDYSPLILIGIWLFIPFSALLAVDNWQRITIASSPRVARQSYVIAGVACGVVYAVICLAGYLSASGQSMQVSFERLVPDGMAWVVAAMLTACIMSSVDTFIMPLTNGVGRQLRIGQMRAIIMLLLAAAALVTIAMGDLLSKVIAAFNTLSVFLPAAMAALFVKGPSARAAIVSMNTGLVTALSLSFAVPDIAALCGFIAALAGYVALSKR